MDYPVEFAATGVNAFAESKYFDNFYDIVTGGKKHPKQAAAVSDSARPRGERPRPHTRRHSPPSPSPERGDLDLESEQSERVLREYEAERDDPSRKPSASLVGSTPSAAPARSRRGGPPDARRDSVRMSHANGGYGRSERPASHRGGGSRYDDYYDDEYDSDYDDRTGRRMRATGRGYDSERDRDFDREIIETERYRGVSS